MRSPPAGSVLDSDRSRVVQEAGWRRLQTIRGIGPWTTEIMALSAQRRLDQVPAGDLSFIKWVGRHLSGGDPYARADEQQVRDFFERFGPWKGLAASYALRLTGITKNAMIAA